MMAAEEHGNDVEIQQLEPQPVLSIRATVRIDDLAQAQGDRIRALSDYLQQRGAQAAGPPFARYHTFTATETDLELGIPVVEGIEGEGLIAAGELPGGPAITTWHIGPHDTLALEQAVQQGHLVAAEVASWWRALVQAATAGQFFAGFQGFIVSGRAPCADERSTMEGYDGEEQTDVLSDRQRL